MARFATMFMQYSACNRGSPILVRYLQTIIVTGAPDAASAVQNNANSLVAAVAAAANVPANTITQEVITVHCKYAPAHGWVSFYLSLKLSCACTPTAVLEKSS